MLHCRFHFAGLELIPQLSSLYRKSSQSKHLAIIYADYPTPDGNSVRDYIHVMDMAQGHLSSLDYIVRNPGMVTLNLGTTQGQTLLGWQAQCGLSAMCAGTCRWYQNNTKGYI